MGLVNLFQTLFHDVGIDLRRGNIAVTKHQLDGAKIGAAFQEMGGKTVTQHVGRKRHTQTGLAAISRENLPAPNAAEATAAAIEEQDRRMGGLPFSHKLWAGIAQIALDQRHRFLADRNDAPFTALPAARTKA